MLKHGASAEASRKATFDEIEISEAEARRLCKDATEKQAQQYMRSKEGIQKIKAAAIKLVEQADFKAKMDAKASEHGKQRLGKQEALTKARANYRTELYMANVQEIATEFRRLRDDVADRRRKELDAALERSRRPPVVGATTTSGRARQGRHFWHGCLAHVAVYDCHVTADDVARHCRAGETGGAAMGGSPPRRARDAARLFALAAEHFAAACVRQPDDAAIREQHAAPRATLSTFFVAASRPRRRLDPVAVPRRRPPCLGPPSPSTARSSSSITIFSPRSSCAALYAPCATDATRVLSVPSAAVCPATGVRLSARSTAPTSHVAPGALLSRLRSRVASASASSAAHVPGVSAAAPASSGER